MKKFACIILSLAFVAVCFSSCSSKKDEDTTTTTEAPGTTLADYAVVEPQSTQTGTEAQTQEATTEATTAATTAATTKGTAPATTEAAKTPTTTKAQVKNDNANKGSFSSSDAAAVINGKTVKPGANYASVSSALGNPSSVTQAPSCHYSGMDNIYTFSGFTVYTYFSGSAEIIYDIEITSASFATAKGVKVGDSADKVKEYYGSPASETDDYIEYTSGSVHMGFYIFSGTVDTIELATD